LQHMPCWILYWVSLYLAEALILEFDNSHN
jgi:hypothetical protein